MKNDQHIFSRWRPHPWHGLSVGPNPPSLVNAYIEITAFDSVKYEIDKETGYLRIDRPQRTTSQPPTLYGFIPRTYGGPRVGKLMKGAKMGDEDPLDICVLCERPVNKSEIILTARVVGGIPMIDHDEADDKIIAVLDQDFFWSKVRDISELPTILIERLRHYFLTYKLIPGDERSVTIGEPYGQDHARKVVAAAIKDYQKEYLSTLLSAV